VKSDGRTLILVVHRNAEGRLDWKADPQQEGLAYWSIDISRFAPGGAGATCAGASELSASLLDVPMATQSSAGAGASESSASRAPYYDLQPTPLPAAIAIDVIHGDSQTTSPPVQDASMHGVILLDEGLNGVVDWNDGDTDLNPDELPIVQQAMSRRNACLKDAGAPIGSVSGLIQWANGRWVDRSLPKCERRTPKSTMC